MGDYLTNHLLMVLLMYAGWAVHVFGVTHARDKATENDIGPMDVFWRGPERWKTCATVLSIALIGMLAPDELFDKLADFTVQGVGVGWLAPVVVGYGIDSVTRMLFSISKKKPGG